MVDGVWTLAVTLPPDIDVDAFIAATAAENVPWLHGEVSSSAFRVSGSGLEQPMGQTVRVPFGLGYSDDEREQLSLVAAKVIYYLRGEDRAADQEAEAAGDAPVSAAGPA